MLKTFIRNHFTLLCFGSAIVICLSVNECAAQKVFPEIILSIDAEDVTLRDLLTTISEQSGIPFSYNPGKIPAMSKTRYHVTDASLKQVLQDLASTHDLTFEFVENQIIVKADRPRKRLVTLSGTIRDAATGEALIGASVYIRELQSGAVTNPFGFYSLSVPTGSYQVAFSFIGYRNTTQMLNLTDAIRQEVSLEEEAPFLQEVEVSSIPSAVDQLLTGSHNIRPSAVERRPEPFGEMDVVKSLESIPGVKFHSDGSTFYYVRGGHRDQNVVFIDDAPIYNPSHLLGMFSTIIPDAVNDITLYKGDMPASLGGRLSSVLDVRTKKGNNQHFSAWGSVGLISSKAGIEGPFKKNNSSYLLSARVSSVGWLLKAWEADVRKFNFHDLTGKMNFRLSNKNRLYFSFYSGADNYFGRNNGISWSNNAATLQWNHLFNDRLFLNTTIAGGGYDYFLHTNLQTGTKWNSHISNFHLKTDFSYFVRPENEITFGMGLNGYGFNPGNLQSNVDISAIPAISVRNAAEFVLYGNHEVRFNDKFGVNYGLRFSSWTNLGEAFEFIFDENGYPSDTLFFRKGESYKRFLNAEPRVSVSYFPNERMSLKLGFSRNVQNIHLVSNSISPFTSLDVWLPSSLNIRPQLANQFSAGYYYHISSKNISLSAEAFYKKMLNQIDYEPHAQILLNPLLESELEFGTARSYGVELLAEKDEGRVHGLIGYTWSRAKRTFPGINNGVEYNAFYDRPHQINLSATYVLSTRWLLSANWNYGTGAPYTAPVSYYSFNGREVPLYGDVNNERLPDYHRMDISATHTLNKNPDSRFTHQLSFSVFNFYGRKNALFINFNKTESADGTLKIPVDLNDSRNVISQFYLYGFTPSVSYNFKWL